MAPTALSSVRAVNRFHRFGNYLITREPAIITPLGQIPTVTRKHWSAGNMRPMQYGIIMTNCP